MKLVRRQGATLALIFILWVAFASRWGDEQALRDTFGLAAGGDSNFLHIFTSGMTSSTLAGCIYATLVIALLGTVTERTLGTPRFILAVLISQAVAVPLGLGIANLAFSPLASWEYELAHGVYLSPAAWVFGASAMASATMPTLWRRRIRTFGSAIVLTMFFFTGSIPSVVSLTALACGWIGGDLAYGRAREMWSRPVISIREKRILVAIVLGSVTIAPLIVGFHGGSHGPFQHIIQFVWEPSAQEVRTGVVCQNPGSSACVSMLGLGQRSGVGFAISNVMPFLVQLVLAYGLTKGRRIAWVGSVIAMVINLGIILTHLIGIDRAEHLGENHVLSDVVGSLPWIGCLIILVAFRSYFEIRRGSMRRVWAIVGGGALASAVIWLIGVTVLSDSFVPEVGIGNGLAELPLRLLPPVMAILFPLHVVPVGAGAWFLYSWVGLIFWVCVIVALAGLFRGAGDQHHEGEMDRVRAIFESGTGDHLSFMTLWEGNSYFITEDGYVAYRVYHGVAVTTGSPVYVGDEQRLASDFEDYVARQGWRCAWYSVPATFTRPGFRYQHVADESVLPASTEFTGKKYQNIRTASNNAAKDGIRTVWTSWDELDVDMKDKIVALSEEWVADKALPEMGFTLGSVTELAVDGTKLLLAVDEAGRLHGVTSWLPVNEGGALVGYTLDFMRRDADGFRSVIELLLADAVGRAREEGLAWVSLSGAPLASSAPVENQGALDKMLDRAGGAMEPLYGFRSLAASKYKFHPEHTSWNLAYDDELALPSIGLAVVSAYVPHMSVGDARATAKAWLESIRDRSSRD